MHKLYTPQAKHMRAAVQVTTLQAAGSLPCGVNHPERPDRTCDSQLGTQGALWINPSACPRQLRLVQRQAGVAALFQVLHGGIHGRQIEDEAAGWAAARSICKGQGIAKCHATQVPAH